MFALAIWDRRHRRLVLARDRLGKKPRALQDFRIVDSEIVRELADAHVAGRANYSKALWALVTLHLWLEQAARRTRLDAPA